METKSTRKIAKELAKKHGGEVKAYDSDDALLADKDVQAVYISSPAYLHREQFEKAARAGKDILVEKPLGMTVGEAEEMVGIRDKHGIKATEGYMLRFHPLHEKAREMIASGKLGTVVMARAQLSCWYPPMEGAWRQVPGQGGGGSLMDMATHCYDLLQDMIGPIKEVFAFTNSIVHKYPQPKKGSGAMATEDSATTLVRFENGAHGIIDAFFNVRDEACLRRLEIYGSNGSVLADGTIGQGGGTMEACLLGAGGGYDADQKRDEAEGFQQVEPGEYNMYRGEIEYLSNCILKDKVPTINTLENGVEITKLVEAAYQSAASGQKVSV